MTHFKELEKRSDAGRLVVDVLGSAAEQVRWERNRPPARLLEEIEAGDELNSKEDRLVAFSS